jgi:2-polyprenyl-6-methoxyphenol hydroxylase-like FAD-dependent oxidoreductase
MRRIAIIGAGQSGLQLGLGLLHHGYEVTLITSQTAEQIERGRVSSSQCMFGRSLAIERGLGLDFWQDDCPAIEGMIVQVGGAEGRALHWSARLDRPARSVDQRVKHAAWLRLFALRGGHVQVQDASTDLLERCASSHDLVIVAGCRAAGAIFERDASRSPFAAPQRALALTYVRGMAPSAPFTAVSASFIPGVGECFIVPALTTTGPCEIMVFEGIPGGPMDCWEDVTDPAGHLARSLAVLDHFVPWEAARCEGVELTDAGGVLAGRFAPTVRHPVARLPSGAAVLGLGDAVVLNDPITGQGANNACAAADIYLRAILDHGDRPFDAGWMEDAFAAYWDYAQWATGWTNAMLMPPPPHMQRLLGAAAELPGVAAAIVNGFDNPASLFPWIADPDEADRFIAAGGRAAASEPTANPSVSAGRRTAA